MTMLPVVTGSPGSFVQVTCGDEAEGAQGYEQLGIASAFFAHSGTTYYFLEYSR